MEVINLIFHSHRKQYRVFINFALVPPIESNNANSRYGRSGNDYDDYDTETSSRAPKSRFRSRFVRSHQQEDNSDNEQGRGVRFHEKEKEKERERVLDTEDVSRGTLSGIIRLADSPRVMKRLQEQGRPKKEKKEVPQPAATNPAVQPKRVTAPAPVTTRQMSEDEIDRIKRQNKGSTSTMTTSATPAPALEPERPIAERVAALKSRTTSNVSATSEDSDNSSATSPVRRTPTHSEVSFDGD